MLPARCRVGFDPGSIATDSQRRGIGRMTRNLVDALAAVPGIELVALERGGVRRRSLRRRTAAAGADVLLSTAAFPPRRPAGVPVVQVLYDVIPLVDPDPRFEPARRLWRDALPAWRAVDRVVALSSWSARTGALHLGLDESRIDVVPLAPAAEFTADGPAAVRDRPYAVVATTWGPHKGIEVAIDAMDELADAGLDLELVVAGDQLPYGQARLEEARAGARHPERVVLAGWVPDLAALYRGAAVVLVPSRFEGFGLPAVEAMACGVPVVASAGSGLSEAVGEGGVLVEPGDAASLAAQVARLLTDGDWRSEVVARGSSRVASLSWAATAEGYAASLRLAATRSSAVT